MNNDEKRGGGHCVLLIRMNDKFIKISVCQVSY